MQAYVDSYSAACELQSRRKARIDPEAFAEYVYPGYIKSHHVREICDALMRVASGASSRLMIMAPPRHSKSITVSHLFPAWYLGNFPTRQFLAVTYGDDLANDFGRRVRNTISSLEYQAIFPGVSLNPDARAAGRWETSHGGIYVSAGRGGTLTGRGAHCFPAGTLVQTNQGPVSIENLGLAPSSCKVLSFNHAKKTLEYRRRQAFSVREGVGIYRVTSASGKVVEATGDHPFYSGGRYVKANELTPGDPVMLLLQDGVHSAGLRIFKDGSPRSRGRVLREIMFGGASCNKKQTPLRHMWEACRKKGKNILSSMQAKAKRQSSNTSARREDMPYLQQSVCGFLARKSFWIRDLLLEILFRQRSLATHVGSWESEMEAWSPSASSAATCRESIPSHAPSYSGARWERLRRMWGERETPSCSPYRRMAHEQCGIKSGVSVQFMSSAVAFGEGFEAIDDTVAMVERVCEKAIVYDIQVEENANFFANGFLVHNCLLFDDMIKNREEADSQRLMEKLIESYDSDMKTRLMPGGAIIIMGTPWGLGDFMHRVLEKEPDQWEVLKFPAIQNEGTENERALWPEWYPLEQLQSRRATTSHRTWRALYQQDPQPEGGTYFEQAWFDNKYDNLPPRLAYYMTADFAVTEKVTGESDDPDYTEIAIWGIEPHRIKDEAYEGHLYAVDWWHGQTGPDKWIYQVVRMAEQYKVKKAFFEAGVIRRSLESTINKNMRDSGYMFPIDWIPSVSDKTARARAFQALSSMDKVKFPKQSAWMPHVMGHILPFPAAKHDDAVDACSLIGLAIEQVRPLVGDVRIPRVSARNSWKVL